MRRLTRAQRAAGQRSSDEVGSMKMKTCFKRKFERVRRTEPAIPVDVEWTAEHACHLQRVVEMRNRAGQEGMFGPCSGTVMRYSSRGGIRHYWILWDDETQGTYTQYEFDEMLCLTKRFKPSASPPPDLVRGLELDQQEYAVKRARCVLEAQAVALNRREDNVAQREEAVLLAERSRGGDQPTVLVKQEKKWTLPARDQDSISAKGKDRQCDGFYLMPSNVDPEIKVLGDCSELMATLSPDDMRRVRNRVYLKAEIVGIFGWSKAREIVGVVQKHGGQPVFSVLDCTGKVKAGHLLCHVCAAGTECFQQMIRTKNAAAEKQRAKQLKAQLMAQQKEKRATNKKG
ncbi:hypothetical protein B484DRAFT_434775 [Ochromonadaceae sp. CCMP2298]|nr:hypothetical protein B484DRAFT_434775 [Ochromonadaceae sp. CCMP2298]